MTVFEFRYACDDCRLNAYVKGKNINSTSPFCSYDPTRGQWNKSIYKGKIFCKENTR